MDEKIQQSHLKVVLCQYIDRAHDKVDQYSKNQYTMSADMQHKKDKYNKS